MGQSKEELKLAFDAVSNTANMLHIALSDVMADEHVMVGRFTQDGIKIIVYLVGAERMDGGTLLVKQTCGKQSPSYTVFNLEKEHQELYRRLGTSDYAREMYNVAGNALICRNRILAEMKDGINCNGR